MSGVMRELCLAEVYDFHRFLVGWYTSRMERSELHFLRFADVLVEDFRLVRPDGALIGRQELKDRVWKAYGTHAKYSPPFRIWVDRFAATSLGADHLLVTYEEWQEVDAVTKGRMSTAVFRVDEQTPNGVAWVHVHETWLRRDDETTP